MMYHIPDVLSTDQVAEFTRQLAQAEWVDGRVTVGSQGAAVRSIPERRCMPACRPLCSICCAAIRSFFPPRCRGRFPRRCLTAMGQGKTYGFHVDGAVRQNGEAGWMRTDLSATLFLCDPESYEGGELVIEDTYGQHRVKLPAGHLVLYPASSLHCVTPVTRGVRQASFLWIQSMVRDDKQRAMLYDLDRTIQSLKARFGDGEEVLSLLNMYHNLLRQWTEV
ncbi:iron-uptake factor PiuC [Klebsiella pneumoniae]|nr:iron-uptake factor PiuC [Klebsiella pneumoniae]